MYFKVRSTMIKSQELWEGWVGVAVLKEVNTSFTEEVTFEQRVERIQGGAFQVQNTASVKVLQ